eukprot:TRINITY_DN2109_c0_g1_i2.p2 TRINITY_DN2109_c0_g1~~TRINITY_DN2109_c0_g1_i2.p2  ORF type:complete len:303 (+),score=146.50 TRINITY_DN2109_c0_g1_i2:264-1172(+)
MCLQTAPAAKPPTVKKVGKYLIGSKIGSGSFSTVHIGVDSETSERVAIKICCNKQYKEKNMVEDLDNELRTLHMGQGTQHVLELKGEMRTTNNTYIVMELCGLTLLDEVMKAEKFDAAKTKLRFRELIQGVKHLHSRGIVHRDIKPENVMIGTDGVSKLGDFGFARCTSDKKIAVGAGTAEYLAPEAFINRKRGSQEVYDFLASDMWACGVVLYAMLTGRLPYSREQVKGWRSLSDVPMPELSSSLDPQAVELIKALLCPTASRRPTAEAVLKHPFLKSSSPMRRVQKLGKHISRALSNIKI